MAVGALVILGCLAIGAFMVWMIKETLKIDCMDSVDIVGIGVCAAILGMCVFAIVAILTGA